ncbi:MAG: ATPase AAA [Candidatus Entotheonella factor]|uniref:ATP-dependent zinc metalloprotease FtsH n=3 Tax=Candidatus Entotheonella TaxID=93171 RepID=W4LWI3_ENTF1|nr:MAG: ATPase AAA [Candidatus Entotheonella factor]
MLVLQNLLFAQPFEQWPYSKFKAYLRDGRVAEVRIDSQTIRGKLTEAESDGPEGRGRKSFTTVRVDDPELISELEKHHVDYRGQYENDLLKSLLSWIVPLSLIFLLWMLISRRMGPGQGVMNFGKSRARIYAERETGVTFVDVAGVEEAKEELQEIIDFLRYPQKYAALGGRIPKGVLLVGPPGTGKTLLARAVAGEASVPFFTLSGSDFVEMFVGVGAARVRDLFKQAQEKAPCIVFIDELDAVGKARGINPVQQNDEREQTLNQLLAEMDGFDPRKGVIILGATNRPEILDPALLRAGRFDRQVVVARPDLEGREEILKLHGSKVRLAEDVDLHVIAARTPGMVGSDLANVINEGALLAARYNKEAVTMDELDEAIDRILAGPAKKSRIMAPKEKRRVAYHESGHTLVAEALPTADPVRKVTIIPHGVAALGYTQQLPTEDRYLYTKEELLDRIAVMLGGRAAEEVIFHDLSTGAQDDLQRASEMARRMVTEFGMGETLGPYAVEQGRQAMFLDSHSPSPKTYSEDIARNIDQEAQNIVERMYQRANQVLTEHRDKLEIVAQHLLAHEVIDQATLATLLSDWRPGKEPQFADS